MEVFLAMDQHICFYPPAWVQFKVKQMYKTFKYGTGFLKLLSPIFMKQKENIDFIFLIICP